MRSECWNGDGGTQVSCDGGTTFYIPTYETWGG